MSDEIPHGLSRRIVLRNGLLAGLGAAVVGVAAPVLTDARTGTARAAVASTPIEQPSWAWCDKCQGLFYGIFQSSSWCPAGGQHNDSESYIYTLDFGFGSSDGYQAGWAWCDKCQGLFYRPFQSSSWCPAGGQHDGSESYNYGMYYNQTSIDENGAGIQSGWAWCDKCQGQFYGAFQSLSWCPAGGQHNDSESYNYAVYFDGKF
jgi:hypothetical protein